MYKIQAKNIYVTVKCLSVKHHCIFRFVLYSSTGKQTNKKKTTFLTSSPHLFLLIFIVIAKGS